MAREADIEFQCHTGLLGRETISTMGSQSLAKIERLVALAMAAEREAAYKRRGTYMFNPYTGTPRHPSDILGDPHAILLPDPEQPIRAGGQA